MIMKNIFGVEEDDQSLSDHHDNSNLNCEKKESYYVANSGVNDQIDEAGRYENYNLTINDVEPGF